MDLKKRLGSKHACDMSESAEPRRGHSESQKEKEPKRKTVFKRLEKGVFHMLRDKGKSTSAYSNDSRRRSYHSNRRDTKSCYQSSRSMETEFASEKHHNKRASSRRTETLSKSEHPEDLLKIFQAVAKMERWAMPTWCHMFNSTLTGNSRVWFDELPKESINSYDDLKEAFLENYLQQKNASKIRLKITISSREMGNPRKSSCGGRLPEPIKARAKAAQIHLPRKNTKRNSGFGQKEAQASSANDNPRHNTNERMRQIEEMLKAGKLSHLIKELKQNNGKDQAKAEKKEETSGKEKPLAILMVQPWQRVAKQKITQTFSPKSVISFSPLGEEDETEGPMIIEAEMRGNFVHRMYVDGGFSSEILYEHRFNRFCLEVKSQMIPAATPLLGFSGEIIGPLGQISLLVKIRDGEHSPSAWMNFMIVRSPSPYNRIIRRKKLRRIQAVSSTAHEMLKFLVTCRTVTLRSSRIIPLDPRARSASTTELHMLTAPKEKEELVIYLAAAKEAISAVLMTERDGKQMPIYFVSRTLQGPKINYTPMEKLILALMLSNSEVAGRLVKWRFGLEEHDIHYRPRTSVKGHNLVDFTIERLEDDPPDTPMEDKEELSDLWILFTDGSSCIDGFRAGLIITNLEGTEFTYALRRTKQDDIYQLRSPKQTSTCRRTQGKFNRRKECASGGRRRGRTWMTLIYEYLTEESLLEKKRKARAIRRKAGRYAVTNKILYKRSFLGPWYRCVGPLHADYVLREIHKGSCIMHASLRSVVAKALRSRYYWPTMYTNARKLIRECSSCQMEEISHVLWAHHTMIKSINGEASFSLTYGTEAVIPVEIGMPTLRTVEVNVIKNDKALEINLDLLEEKREQIAIHEAKSKAMMKKCYNAWVRNTSFKTGDLIYRNNEAGHAEEGGKLGPKWEGPYEVTEALGKGAYKLRDCNGSILPRTWNVYNLKKCHVHEM
uniref:Reverse transcriptase domain-containing protein n=1 Tax=Tanacetum cinerariifolium TaxID=118510 RepID=A0A6L2PA41_TANCI|nr:reverse transcriptase domain-containing protein [Tanacetum cinerariifolium]